MSLEGGGEEGSQAVGRVMQRPKGVQYFCDFCRREVTKQMRIKCAECSDFDLCLSCFSAGREVFDHKKTHRYRVIEHVASPILDPDWGADEEVLFIEGICMFGLGNWVDIAEHVGTKSKMRCEQHFQVHFALSKLAPLPLYPEKIHAAPATLSSGSAESVSKAFDPSWYKKRRRSSVVYNSLGPVTENSLAAAADPNPSSRKKNDGPAALVGYQPLRGDFDVEFDNDFEKIICDMEFRDDDTALERDLKFKVLEAYNRTLDERLKRKNFILDRGLLNSKAEKEKKQYTKEEMEIIQNLNAFARFHSKEEHEQFVEGMILEYRLRRKIEKLQHHRLVGIRTLVDSEIYDAEKSMGPSRRSKHAASRRNGGASDSESTLETPAKRKQNQSQAFDVTKLEGYKKLSEAEARLCEMARITPLQYFELRKHIVTEAVARGLLDLESDNHVLKIEINKTGKMFDFFVSDGWDYYKPQSKQTEQNT